MKKNEIVLLALTVAPLMLLSVLRAISREGFELTPVVLMIVLPILLVALLIGSVHFIGETQFKNVNKVKGKHESIYRLRANDTASAINKYTIQSFGLKTFGIYFFHNATIHEGKITLWGGIFNVHKIFEFKVPEESTIEICLLPAGMTKIPTIVVIDSNNNEIALSFDVDEGELITPKAFEIGRKLGLKEDNITFE